MNVVFLSSPTEKKEKYDFILDVLKKYKLKVFNGTYPFKADLKQLQRYEADVIKEIKKCDAMVVEGTNTTIDLGRFITLGLQQHKSVLLLQKEGQSTQPLLSNSRLVKMTVYNPAKTAKVKEIIDDFIDQMKKQRLVYRFNLMLSPDINEYVMDKAQKQGISKADYIRSLIADDMTEE